MNLQPNGAFLGRVKVVKQQPQTLASQALHVNYLLKRGTPLELELAIEKLARLALEEQRKEASYASRGV